MTNTEITANTVNPFNNENNNWGVIWSEIVDGHKIDCKIEMTDNNINIDGNGLLTLISMTQNNNMPQNIHYLINDDDNMSENLTVQAWIDDNYFADIKWSDFDPEYLLSDAIA